MAEVAGEVKLLLTVDGTTWSKAIDQAQREIDKLKGKTTEAARVTRAEMTEARHAIHLLGDEIGIHLPRAVQGFVAKLPGVAEIMASAFSAAAVVGLGLAIFEAGKKVVEFMEKQKKAAEEARAATEKLVEGRHLATLELEASTAKLDEQIARLEKKPGDGLKTALAEARLEAFKLGQQLGADIEQAQKLIETQFSAGILKRMAGAAGSEGTLEQLADYKKQVAEISKIVDPTQRTAEMVKLTGAQVAKLNEEIAARERLGELQKKFQNDTRDMTAAERTEYGTLDKRFPAVDQTEALRGLKVFQAMVEEQSDYAQASQEHIESQAKADALTAAKEREDLAKEAAAALKRQTAERMSAMEAELANEKAIHAMTLEEERSFWQKRYMAGTQLADPINELIVKRIAPLSQEIFKKQTADMKEWLAMMAALQQEADRMFAASDPFAADRAQQRTRGETDAARIAALHDRPDVLRQITNQQEELNAAEMVSSGLMTKQTEEAIKQQHVVERLQDELEDLQGKRAAVANLPSSLYTPGMNPEALDNQIALKQAQLGAAQQTLQYQTERDTFGGEMKQMFTEWIARATDVRQAMAGLFEQTLSTVNNAILQTMTEKYHRGDWKAAGKSIAANVAGAGLSFAEGSIGKALGFGGKMGTRDNPMWVRDAGTAVGAAGGSVLKSVVDTTLMAGSGTGNAIAKAFGLAASIPFLAAGGSLPAGMPAIVGERGPELFIPSGSGRVIPNDQLRNGGTQHVWNIDARGSTNPGAVRLAVQRGIMEAAPRIAAGSIAAARDMDSRKPTMSK
jgi:hypothetical protein